MELLIDIDLRTFKGVNVKIYGNRNILKLPIANSSQLLAMFITIISGFKCDCKNKYDYVIILQRTLATLSIAFEFCNGYDPDNDEVDLLVNKSINLYYNKDKIV